MKKTSLLILVLGVFIFTSCNSDRTEEKTLEDVDTTQSELTPVEVVTLFIESLGDKDFESAYNLQVNSSWGDYQKFRSVEVFGGINATAINEIKAIQQNPENAKIYVDAYYYDPVNGNNRFQQYFYMIKVNKLWRIERLEQTIIIKKTPEEQIKELLDDYSFFDSKIDESKNKNIIYSFPLHNSDKLFIAFTSNEDFSCHACYTYMSVFKFSSSNIMQKKFIKSHKIGSWGLPPKKEDIKIHAFNGDFMFTIEGGYIGMGIIQSDLSCYYILNGNLNDIGAIPIGFDNTGAYLPEDPRIEVWTAVAVDFVQSNESVLPDIIIRIARDSYNDPGQSFFRHYSFDGSEYVQI